MKKICFITSGVLPVPAVKGGAIEQLIQQLCEDNEKNPHFDLTVITKRDISAIRLEKGYRYTHFFHFRQFEGVLYKLSWKGRGLMRKLTGNSVPQLQMYEFQTINHVKKYANNYDLIIAEGCDMDMMYEISRIAGKEKVCLHLHGYLLANNDCDDSFGSLIGVSDFIKKAYLSTSKTMPTEHTYVLLNGVDSQRFQKAITIEEKTKMFNSLGFDEDDFIVVFCGRIVQIKGVLELIHAVLSIPNPKIKLLIIGSSDFGNGNLNKYSQEVQKLSEDNRDRIVYTGYVDNKDIYKYYHIASVGAVPSLWNEPCALVTLEMMHSGLATIATRVGGTPELFTGETTLFIPFDSNVEYNLRNCICKMYESPELCKRLAQNALERAKMFTREIYFDNFCKIANDILSQSK